MRINKLMPQKNSEGKECYKPLSFFVECCKGARLKITCILTAGAASQCYQDELMLLKYELMLLKCKINTINKKNDFCILKCLEKVLKYSYLVSIILDNQFPKTMLADFFVLILDFNNISSHFKSITSHFNSISSHLNSINSSQQH